MALQIKRSSLLLSSFLFLLLLSSCHVDRYVWWNYADADDYRKFPADTIRNGETSHPFNTAAIPVKFDLPEKYRTANLNSVDDLLASKKSLAFLVIRNDSVVYEHYYHGTSRSSVLASFSVAKSFVAALIGIAIQEGSIKSIDQPVTDFIPEMKDPGFKKVTIGNLLTMRSGIKFNEGYKTPFGEMAKFYYGKNLKKYTLKLKVSGTPGEKYEYQSGNTQILAMVLERATGKTLPEYLEEKIWKPAGMEFPATWNTDSRKHHEVKSFCCINARAVDFAKFGQLFLDQGRSDEKSVIPASWIKATLNLETGSRDSQGYPYTYLWRVTKEKNFFAKGLLGQYIFVCPSKHIVIVRFGEEAGDLVWPELFRQLSLQL